MPYTPEQAQALIRRVLGPNMVDLSDCPKRTIETNYPIMKEGPQPGKPKPKPKTKSRGGQGGRRR